ncbi:MAG: hypothetical protein DRG83_04615 [Deltaproteobacteria bacterium]|nr:MAG: hypothetical protein DRG83_04615 [Deltaproteobacteria bacterium]
MFRRLLGWIVGIGLILRLLFFQLAYAQGALDKDDFGFYQLGEVIVVGKRASVPKKFSVVRLSGEMLKISGADNISDALLCATGLLPTTGRKNESDILIRGIKQNRSVVFIDGIPVNLPLSGGFDLSQIPVNDVAEIRVVKGIPSVLYGANALGGVIDIITKKGRGKPLIAVSNKLSNNNTHHLSGSVSGSHDRINFYLSGSYKVSNGWDVSEKYTEGKHQDSGTRRTNSDYEKCYAHMKIGLESSESREISLSYTRVSNESGIPPSDNPAIVKPLYWRWDKWLEDELVVSCKIDLFSRLLAQARFYYRKHEDTLNLYPDDAYENPDEISKLVDHGFGGNLFIEYLGFRNRMALKAATSLVMTNHKQQLNSLLATPWEKVDFLMYSFGIEPEILLTKYLALIIGISFDGIKYNKVNGKYANIGKFKHPIWPGKSFEGENHSAVNPQLTVRLKAYDGLIFNLNIGQRTRFPNVQELFSTRGGNYKLKPETALSYELEGRFILPKKRGDITLAIFYTSIQDYIHRINNRTIFTNISRVVTQGVDGELNLVFGSLKANFGLSYLWRAKDEMHDLDLPETPKYKYNFTVHYGFPLGLSTDLLGLYVGKRPVYDKAYCRIGSLSSYTLFNFRLSQDLEKIRKLNSWLRNFEWEVGVHNITDENYYSEPGFPGKGRSFWLGIRIKI